MKALFVDGVPVMRRHSPLTRHPVCCWSLADSRLVTKGGGAAAARRKTDGGGICRFRRKRGSIRRRLIDRGDDEHVDRRAARFEFEPELGRHRVEYPAALPR